METRYLVGIDEAGRGPLAGPVAVGVVCLELSAGMDVLRDMRDSKALTEKRRDELYRQLKASEHITLAVAMVGAKAIDEYGIQHAIRTALVRALKRVAPDPLQTRVLLDGGLRAPLQFIEQKTIIHGDALEPIIGAASIAAKVTRDAYMIRQHGRYESYDFERHKGYGTRSHREAIACHGLTPLHRRTFCRNIA